MSPKVMTASQGTMKRRRRGDAKTPRAGADTHADAETLPAFNVVVSGIDLLLFIYFFILCVLVVGGWCAACPQAYRNTHTYIHTYIRTHTSAGSHTTTHTIYKDTHANQLALAHDHRVHAPKGPFGQRAHLADESLGWKNPIGQLMQRPFQENCPRGQGMQMASLAP